MPGELELESGIISISRPKQRRAQEYPLVSQVGEAILRYLQQVRPRCARREVFLTHKAPFRRLSQGALYRLVARVWVHSESRSHAADRTLYAMPVPAAWWRKGSH